MKKSTLWIFGDSYAVPFFDKPETEIIHWAGQLYKQLNCSKVEFRAHRGAANEWIYHQFQINLPNITEDDYVVFVSTQTERRWFFLNNIGSSNFNVSNVSQSNLSKDEIVALKYYGTYLDNYMMSSVIFDTICNSVHYVSQKQNLNTIILPGFEEAGHPISGKYTVNGSLFDVCVNEIKGKSDKAWFNFISNVHKGLDPRIGHLSYVNHCILSDKLFDTFKNNKILDLTTGFEEEIL